MGQQEEGGKVAAGGEGPAGGREEGRERVLEICIKQTVPLRRGGSSALCCVAAHQNLLPPKLAHLSDLSSLVQARVDPDNAPVVLWMTGGPGCSSELAVFFENGGCECSGW
jgi:hypothetical protein